MYAQDVRNGYRKPRSGGLQQMIELWDRNWFKWALSLIALLAILHKDIALSISLNPSFERKAKQDFQQPAALAHTLVERVPPLNVSLITAKKTPPATNPTPAGQHQIQNKEDNRKKQEAYIRRYAHLAQIEMHKYGIPASITLAQGLLETNAGESPLATEANNHFGIKCFSKACRRGHCRNFEDDSHKDFFRIYANPAESFRAHSALLRKPRYKSLFTISKNDYSAWAKGLKQAGYATDPSYADKIIRIIKEFKLFKYDH